MVGSQRSVYYGVADWPGILERSGLSPKTTILVHFSKDHVVNPRTWEPACMHGPQGVSGGALFGWPKDAALSLDWSLPLLIGIAHTYRKSDRVFVGTRTGLFLDIIARSRKLRSEGS